MPHKLKKNIEHFDQEVKDLGPEGEGNWEELLLKHSLHLIILTLTFHRQESSRPTSQSESTQPLKVRPALGISTLYPIVPLLWPILGGKIKFRKLVQFYLRFVSSSAPTLRSALHFCKAHMYCESFHSEGKYAIINRNFVNFFIGPESDHWLC